MTDAVAMLLANGPPSPEKMRENIAALYRSVPCTRDPADADVMLALLRLLYRVARADLPLARLFEGQIDALQIIARYGDANIVDRSVEIAAEGGAFGVWNAALPDEPLRVEDGRLTGGKSYASGAGILTHALAGADTPEGNRLVLIDLDRSGVHIDRDWWNVVGMQRSQTHLVRWEHAAPDSFTFIGAPGDYAREPFFSGGALRFVACHAGGIAAVCDLVRDHLVAVARAADVHQASRLAELYLLAESAAHWVRSASMTWDGPDYVDRVAAARIAVSRAAEQALSIAQQAVGLPGLFVAHPLSAALTDLMVYIRQPAPDAQRLRVGDAVAEMRLVPDL
jgi:hypothetical protein